MVAILFLLLPLIAGVVLVWTLLNRRQQGLLIPARSCPHCSQQIPTLGSFCPLCGQRIP